MKGLLKTIACFLFTVAISFGVFANNAFAGNFSQTCYDSSVSGSILSSICQRMNGSWQPTAINLDEYIENIDGGLTWQYGNFSQTCYGTGLSTPSVMASECLTRDQRLVPTSINLDQHIANIDGTLKYE
ncbi:CVNH domain-containing protein [Moorena sp. SIO1G6]|uniref:mannose-binding lectin n=1 Tax=Moorena sp. SIO1G6 TaxID=2607840 RepID=UPI00257DD873|nr:CVNH domain-containing protein [Moorena sp. SIO1G6]